MKLKLLFLGVSFFFLNQNTAHAAATSENAAAINRMYGDMAKNVNSIYGDIEKREAMRALATAQSSGDLNVKEQADIVSALRIISALNGRPMRVAARSAFTAAAPGKKFLAILDLNLTQHFLEKIIDPAMKSAMTDAIDTETDIFVKIDTAEAYSIAATIRDPSSRDFAIIVIHGTKPGLKAHTAKAYQIVSLLPADLIKRARNAVDKAAPEDKLPTAELWEKLSMAPASAREEAIADVLRRDDMDLLSKKILASAWIILGDITDVGIRMAALNAIETKIMTHGVGMISSTAKAWYHLRNVSPEIRRKAIAAMVGRDNEEIVIREVLRRHGIYV